MYLYSAQKMSHLLLKHYVKSGDYVVDATMGNGNDTLLLSQLVGHTGKVFSFDIQQYAINNTTQLLKKHNTPNNYQLILDGHQNVLQYIENKKISVAIFNLGYLPKSDKSIITHAHTTILSIQQLLTKLIVGGIIIVVVYYGHNGGLDEKQKVEQFVSTLPQKNYTVAKYECLNQVNCPPLLIVIEHKGH